MLDDALADLVQLMGLETGWIWIKEPAAHNQEEGSYALAAYHHLAPALDPDTASTWAGGCACQRRCNEACASDAYNMMQCSRLETASGDRRGLAVHASAALRSGDRDLGIPNVAGPDWASFSPQSLALLTNVGNQMGAALERARLYDLLREQRIQEQATLLDFSHQLLGRLDLDDVIKLLV